jgi:CcmD family protein
VSDWTYVVLAYAVVWSALATYTLVLRRRIARANASVEHVRRTTDERSSTAAQEEPACEAASVP